MIKGHAVKSDKIKGMQTDVLPILKNVELSFVIDTKVYKSLGGFLDLFVPRSILKKSRKMTKVD